MGFGTREDAELVSELAVGPKMPAASVSVVETKSLIE